MKQEKIICHKVIETAVSLADQGYLAGTGGNVALRIDSDTFAITPSASDYYTMSIDDVCVLRMQDLHQLSGDKAPSVEKGLHAKVFQAFPQCQASIHTHQPIASAYTLLDRPLEPANETQKRKLGAQVPVAGYAPSGTSWLANNIGNLLNTNIRAYLMRNHGVLCWGESVTEACDVVNELENAVRQWFKKTINEKINTKNTALMQQINNALGV